MIKFFKDLLRTNSGVSMMRFMSLLSLLIGAAIAAYALKMRPTLDGVSELVAIFVISAFGGKVAQKHFEGKNEKVD